MKNIPLHLLKDRSKLGLHIKRLENIGLPPDEEEKLGAHRDDHYIFFLLEKASGSFKIDFNEIPLSGSNLYYVLPTQVHHQFKTGEGWAIFVDTALVPPECRNVFEGSLLLQQPYALNEARLSQCRNLLTLLCDKYEEDYTDPFYIMGIHALLQSFLAIAAGCYHGDSNKNLKTSRPGQLTSQFKNLLVADLRSNKSPSDYAAILNVSESYLSEAIKKTTGFPLSYWIQQEVMTEAKRLLYYSQLTVKEIAHTLGYTDHSYFSRLFRKVTGISAITFREQYRK